MKFPFNQPVGTRDCGYRCLYYVLNLDEPYSQWIQNFKYFTPEKNGIIFGDICSILSYHGRSFKFTQVTSKGLFIIYSGIFLHHENRRHGHYFVYQNGMVFCSTRSKPYKMDLDELVNRLEAKSVDLAFRCLKID